MTHTTAVALPTLERTWDVLRPAAGAGFRPREACELAAALFEPPDGQRWRLEGEAARLTWQLDVSPGVLRVRQTRPKTPVKLKARTEPQRTLGLRAAAGGKPEVRVRVEQDDDDVEVDDIDEEAAGRVVAEFSRASRLRMMRRLASLDWAPVVASTDELFDATGAFVAGVPAMVTLTYSGGAWWRWAPTGRAAKLQLAVLIRRWDRAIGPFQGVWKMETQERGAPHFHLFTRVPATVEHKVGRGRGSRFVAEAFNKWMSRVWYEIVGSGDERHPRAGTGVDYGRGCAARTLAASPRTSAATRRRTRRTTSTPRRPTGRTRGQADGGASAGSTR